MNKKLLAVAVAGALAAPGVALAQSSVTISGYLKAGIDGFKITNPSLARGQATNTSETRITDHSSRILFNVVEDLGGGLQAVGQFDLRISLDAVNRSSNSVVMTTGATTAQALGQNTPPALNTLNAGNNHIGLRSKSWGSIRFGRQDTHYGNSGDTIPSKAGHLGAWNSSVFDAVQKPAGGATGNNTIANLSRTPNLMWYDSPKWGGFGFMIGYSTNPTRASTTVEYENDLGTGTRKGRAWTFNPVYSGGNWEVAWSHWNAKSDWAGCLGTQSTGAGAGTGAGVGCNSAQDDQKADSVRGHYIFPMGLRLGLAWNRSKTTGAPFAISAGTGLGIVNTFAGLTTGDRKAWALPISYNTGAHTFYMTYTKAGDSKSVTNNAGATTSGSGTGAKLISLAYNYDLSKRTSVGVTYSRLRNGSGAAGNVGGTYNTFYTGDSAFGGTNGGAVANATSTGEGQRLFGFAIRHGF